MEKKGIINKAKQRILDLPFLRQPKSHSQYNRYFADILWAFQKRNKSIGIGWHTYYSAMRNVWVNACIQTYIDEVINVNYKIKSPIESTIPNNTHTTYLKYLFDNPMGYDSQDTFSTHQTLMWKSYLGLGDAFCEVIYDEHFDRVPCGFNYIPCEFMYYFQETDQWGFIDDSYRFENDELIHIKDPHIRNNVWGESKIDILAKDIMLEILSRDYITDYLENYGLDPNGIIQYGADIDDETWNDEIERLQMEADNVEKGLLILRGATYTSASRANRDMEYQSLMKDIRDRILATYGVPPQRVSIIEVANLGSGSGESQNKQFKKTFKGKAKLFEDAYNRILGKGGFEEYFEYGEIDIEDKMKNAQIDNIRLNNGSITINEVRSTYELSPVPWGDQPMGMPTEQPIDTFPAEMESLGQTDNTMNIQDLLGELTEQKNYLIKNKTLDEIYHNV